MVLCVMLSGRDSFPYAAMSLVQAEALFKANNPYPELKKKKPSRADLQKLSDARFRWSNNIREV